MDRSAMLKSTYVLPSTSVRWARLPDATHIGRWGYEPTCQAIGTPLGMTARPRSMRAALFGCAAANRASSTFLSSRTRLRSTPDWGLVMGRSLGLRRRAGFGPAIGYSARCGEGMRSGRLALL